jgi:hypothetical protein
MAAQGVAVTTRRRPIGRGRFPSLGRRTLALRRWSGWRNAKQASARMAALRSIDNEDSAASRDGLKQGLEIGDVLTFEPA